MHSKPGQNLAALPAPWDAILSCRTSECLKLNIVKTSLCLFWFPSPLCKLSSSVYGPFLFWGHWLTNRQKSGSGKRNDSSKELCHPFLASRGGRDTSKNKKRDRERDRHIERVNRWDKGQSTMVFRQTHWERQSPRTAQSTGPFSIFKVNWDNENLLSKHKVSRPQTGLREKTNINYPHLDSHINTVHFYLRAIALNYALRKL